MYSYGEEKFGVKKQVSKKNQGIDEESFLLLDEGTINCLIPKIGYRLKFVKNFRELIGNAVPPTMPHASSDVPPTATPPSPMEEQTAPMDQIVPLVLQVVPVFDIRQILTASPEGRPILQRLDEDGVITIKQRRCLVRILVSHLMEKFGESPTSQTKNAMASSLVQTFPCLKDTSDSGSEIWYTQSRNHRPATGFLEERLRNIRKRMRSLNRPTRQEGSEPESVHIPDSTISDERAEQMKKWLRHNSQPLSQVEAYMQDTVLYRAQWIRGHNSKNVSEILKEFPHLTTQGMIAQDFQVLHGEAAPKLSETWLPVYTEKILSLARREGKLALPADEMTLDAKGELAFRVLPAMLPPTVYKVGRKVFRHTIEESRLAFIDCKPTVPGQHLKQFLDEVGPFPGNTLSGVILNRKQVGDDDFHKVKEKLINGFCDNLTTWFGNLDMGVLKAAATMFDLSNWPEDITDLATFGLADVETFVTHFQKTDGLQGALWNAVFMNS
ncbi:hypothetical protein ABVT39_024109 [Epinephelus coioides]